MQMQNSVNVSYGTKVTSFITTNCLASGKSKSVTKGSMLPIAISTATMYRRPLRENQAFHR